MATNRSIVTTGQDNIYQIIRDHYPDEDTKAIMKALELANPHIVSLTSLIVGSRLYLPEVASTDEMPIVKG